MMSDIFSSEAFEAAYTYNGKDLGAVWTPDKTTFRVWAPTAKAVILNLYYGGTPSVNDLIRQVSMKPDIKGTWFVFIIPIL